MQLTPVQSKSHIPIPGLFRNIITAKIAQKRNNYSFKSGAS